MRGTVEEILLRDGRLPAAVKKSLWRKDLMGAAETLNIPVFVLDTP